MTKPWRVISCLLLTLILVMGLRIALVSAETVQEILDRVDRQWTAGDETRAVELLDGWLETHRGAPDCLPLVEYLQKRNRDRLALERLYRLEERYSRPDSEEASLQGGRRLLLLRQRQLAGQDVLKRILLLECSLAWPEDFPGPWWAGLTERLLRLDAAERHSFVGRLLLNVPVYWLQHEGFHRFREDALAAGLAVEDLQSFLIARLREADDPQSLELAEQLFSPPVMTLVLLQTRRYEEAEARLGNGPHDLLIRRDIYKETGRWEDFRRELPERSRGLATDDVVTTLSAAIDFRRTDETNLQLARALLERSLEKYPRAETNARLILARDHAWRGETAEALKLLPPQAPPWQEWEWLEAWREILRAFGEHGPVDDDLLRRLFPSPREAETGHDWLRELDDGLSLLEGLERSGRDHPRLTRWTLEAAGHVTPDHLRSVFLGILERLGEDSPRTAMLLAPLVLLREDPGRNNRILEKLARNFGWKAVLERMLQDESSRRILWERLPTVRFPVDAEGYRYLQERSAARDASRKPLAERMALTHLQMQSGRGTEAIGLLEGELTANPLLEERRWIQIGQYYLHSQQLQRGEEFFRGLADKRPWPAFFWSAVLAMTAGRNDAALADLVRLRPAVEKLPDKGRVYAEVFNRFHSLLTGSERRAWLESSLAHPVQGWEGVLVIWMNDRLLAGETAVIEQRISEMETRQQISCAHLVLLIGPAKDEGSSDWLEKKLLELGKQPEWLRKSIRRRMELREKSLAPDLQKPARVSLLQGQARRLIEGSTNPLAARVELALYFSQWDREFSLELGREALRQNDRLDLLEPRLLQVDPDFTRALFQGSPAWLRSLTDWCFKMKNQDRYPELRDELLRVRGQIGLMSTVRLLLMNSNQKTASVILLDAAENLGQSLQGRDRVELVVRLAGCGRAAGLLQRVPLSAEDAWQGRKQLMPVWKTLLAADPVPARALLHTFRFRVNCRERDELVELLGEEFWNTEHRTLNTE